MLCTTTTTTIIIDLVRDQFDPKLAALKQAGYRSDIVHNKKRSSTKQEFSSSPPTRTELSLTSPQSVHNEASIYASNENEDQGYNKYTQFQFNQFAFPN